MDDIFKDLIAGYDPNEKNTVADEKTNLSFWVSLEGKSKFEYLQDKTRKKFGEKLKSKILEVIDECYKKAQTP